jgi:hypothetical protein
MRGDKDVWPVIASSKASSGSTGFLEYHFWSIKSAFDALNRARQSDHRSDSGGCSVSDRPRATVTQKWAPVDGAQLPKGLPQEDSRAGASEGNSRQYSRHLDDTSQQSTHQDTSPQSQSPSVLGQSEQRLLPQDW